MIQLLSVARCFVSAAIFLLVVLAFLPRWMADALAAQQKFSTNEMDRRRM